MAVHACNEEEIEKLRQSLSSPEYFTRLDAVKALGRLHDEAAVVPLQQALRDEEYEIRETAYTAIREIGAKAMPYLVDAMKDGSFYVRMYASLAIADHILENPYGKYSDDLVDALTHALLDKSIYVRRSAYDALKVIEYNKVIKSLINALDDGDYNVRLEAITALGRIGDRRAVKALARTMLIHDPAIRKCAANALGRIGDKRALGVLVGAVEDADGSVRREAIRALGAIGDENAAMYLLCALKDREPVVREEAANALARLKPLRSIAPFLSVLSDESARVRLEAVKAMGRSRDKKAIEPLVSALGDPDAGVRESACAALVRRGKSAVTPLKAVSSENMRAFSTAAKALDLINSSRASKRVKHMAAAPDIDSIIETEMSFSAYDKAGQARLSSFNI